MFLDVEGLFVAGFESFDKIGFIAGLIHFDCFLELFVKDVDGGAGSVNVAVVDSFVPDVVVETLFYVLDGLGGGVIAIVAGHDCGATVIVVVDQTHTFDVDVAVFLVERFKHYFYFNKFNFIV